PATNTASPIQNAAYGFGKRHRCCHASQKTRSPPNPCDTSTSLSEPRSRGAPLRSALVPRETMIASRQNPQAQRAQNTMKYGYVNASGRTMMRSGCNAGSLGFEHVLHFDDRA